MKKFFTLFIVACLLFAFTVPVFAAVEYPIMPMWDNVWMVDCNITFSGTAGKVICAVSGVAGTTSISGTAKLYEGKTEINSWNITGGSDAWLTETFTGVRGVTYRLVLDVEVTKGGVVEPITIEDSATCP